MADEKRPWKEIIENDTAAKKSRLGRQELVAKLAEKSRADYRKKMIDGYLEDSKSLLEKMLESLTSDLEKAARELVRAYYEDRQIITFGNGGSAPIASHIAADLSKAWLGDGLMRTRCFSLVDNVSLLTSWMNDAGQEQMFVGPLQTILNQGDVVIGISSSGTSKNIINALEYANKKGATTIGMCGFSGGRVKEISKISLHVPSDSFKHVEDMHALLGHVLKTVLVNEVRDKKL